MRLDRFVAQRLRVKKQAGQALVDAGRVSVNGRVERNGAFQVFLGNGVVCDEVLLRRGDDGNGETVGASLLLLEPQMRWRRRRGELRC